MAVNNSCRRRRAGVLALLILALGTSGYAQLSGGDFEIRRSTIDAGGGISSGTDFTVRGSIGQPDTGRSSGGRFELEGGFWTRTMSDFLFKDSFEAGVLMSGPAAKLRSDMHFHDADRRVAAVPDQNPSGRVGPGSSSWWWAHE